MTFKQLHDCLPKEIRDMARAGYHHIQGFVTNEGYFVDRKEADQIAFEAGQIPELKDELFSEDLW